MAPNHPAFGATTLIPSRNWAARLGRGVKVKVKVKSEEHSEELLEPWHEWIQRSTHEAEQRVQKLKMRDWVHLQRQRKWRLADWLVKEQQRVKTLGFYEL